MAVEWEQVVVLAANPRDLAFWWADAMSWVVTIDSDYEMEIRSRPDVVPGIVFIKSDDAKVGHNRLHIDLRPDDQRGEVERLLGLGAAPIDVGQGDVSWVVLSDPEGNEFCVLSDRRH